MWRGCEAPPVAENERLKEENLKRPDLGSGGKRKRKAVL